LALLCEAFLDGCLQREDFETPFQLLRMTASFHQVTASFHHHHHHHHHGTATSSSHSLFESRLNSRMSSNSSNASSPTASFHEVTNEEHGVTTTATTTTMFSEVHYATSESEPTTPVRIRNKSSESEQQQQQQHRHHEIEVLSARLAEHRLFVDTRLWESKLESKLRTESGQDDSSYAESAVSLLLLLSLLFMHD
jgi:hypothetical protein